MKKDIESFQSQYAIRNKAALPPKSDEPIMGIKSTKNFVVANAVEAILQGGYITYVCLHIGHFKKL